MDKHSFSYEQYCSVVEKNVILLETSYYDGSKKLKCLNLYNCNKAFGGCKNKFVKAKQEKISRNIAKAAEK